MIGAEAMFLLAFRQSLINAYAAAWREKVLDDAFEPFGSFPSY